MPYAFKLIIDRGFVANGGNVDRWFQYLLLIVIILVRPQGILGRRERIG